MKGDTSKGRVCNICGSIGFNLVTCCACKRISEHNYCMRKRLHYIPERWYCDDCGESASTGGSCKMANSKKQEKPSVAETSFGKNAAPPVSVRPVKNLKVELIPAEEAAFLTNAKVHATRGSLHPQTKAGLYGARCGSYAFAPVAKVKVNNSKVEQLTSLHETDPMTIVPHPLKKRKSFSGSLVAVSQSLRGCTNAETGLPTTKCSIIKEHGLDDREQKTKHNEKSGAGVVVAYNAQGENFGFQALKRPLLLHINSDGKLSDQPVPETCWKGAFDVFDQDFHVFCGVQAHFPGKVSVKVYESLKQMAQALALKVIPRLHVWPKIFKKDPPRCDDIGLFFFPCDLQRSDDGYNHLLEHMVSHDVALLSRVADVNLLVYTSKQLPAGSERLNMGNYLWGIFHHAKDKSLSQAAEELLPSFHPKSTLGVTITDQSNVPAESICMEIDVVRGDDVNKNDEPGTAGGFDVPHTPHLLVKQKFSNQTNGSLKCQLMEAEVRKGNNIEKIDGPRPVTKNDAQPGLKGTVSCNVVDKVDKPSSLSPGFANLMKGSDLKEMDSSAPNRYASCSFSKLRESNTMESFNKLRTYSSLDASPGFMEEEKENSTKEIDMHEAVPCPAVSTVPASSFRGNSAEKTVKHRPVPEFPVPPGFTKPIVNAFNRNKSLVRSESGEVINPTIPDAPPGFSTPYSWKIKSYSAPPIEDVGSVTGSLEPWRRQVADQWKRNLEGNAHRDKWEYEGELREGTESKPKFTRQPSAI